MKNFNEFINESKNLKCEDEYNKLFKPFLNEIENILENGTLSLAGLIKKYPEIIFTMNKKGDDKYFVRADIKTKDGETEYLGAIKGYVSKHEGLEWLNNTAKNNYNKYY